MSVEHKCQKCRFDFEDDDDCFCPTCLEEILQEKYDEGYKDAEKEFKKE